MSSWVQLIWIKRNVNRNAVICLIFICLIIIIYFTKIIFFFKKRIIFVRYNQLNNKMTIPKNEYINLLIRLVVGGMFIITGISKIVSPSLFAREITNYGMMPYELINIMAIVLPWIEVVTGLLFVFGIKIKANLILLAGMLLMFNFAVASAWARGLDINCGCFSDMTAQKVGLKKIAENFAMFAGLAFIFFFPNNKFSLLFFEQNET